MGRSQRITFKDVRDVTELVGHVAEFGSNSAAWRTAALDGLIKLTRARVGLTLDMDGLDGPFRLLEPIDRGWDDDRVRSTFYYEYPKVAAADPGTRSLMAAHARTHFATFVRRELIDDAEWYSSPAVSELRKSGDVDDFASTSFVVRPGVLQGFVLYRGWNAGPFGDRERRLIRLFHAGLMRKYRKGLAGHAVADKVAALPPRARQTLELLLEGDSLKQVASKLNISRHTVNDYTKMIHRQLEVNTRAELMRLLMARPTPPLALPAGLPPPAFAASV